MLEFTLLHNSKPTPIKIHIEDQHRDSRYKKVVHERIHNPEDKRYMFDIDESQELGQIGIEHLKSVMEYLSEYGFDLYIKDNN